jgi:hypothetical protein
MDQSMPWLALMKEWWWVVSVPGTLILGLALAYLKTQFPTKGEFAHLQKSIDGLGKSVDERIDKVEQRASKLEGSLRDLPTRQDIHKLEIKSTELTGEMAAVRQAIGPMGAAIDRIESYLMDSKVPRR